MDDYLYHSLYFAVSKLHRNVTRIAEDHFRSIGIAPAHALIMMHLNQWKELTPSEISNSIDVSPSTMTRFLDKLGKMNYIKRRYEGKFVYVSLTNDGNKIMPKITGMYEEMEFDLLKQTTQTLAQKVKPQLHEMSDRMRLKKAVK